MTTKLPTLNLVDLAERVGWTFVQAFAGSIAAGGTAVGLHSFDWRAALVGAGTAAVLSLLKVLGVSVSTARALAAGAQATIASEQSSSSTLAEHAAAAPEHYGDNAYTSEFNAATPGYGFGSRYGEFRDSYAQPGHEALSSSWEPVSPPPPPAEPTWEPSPPPYQQTFSPRSPTSDTTAMPVVPPPPPPAPPAPEQQTPAPEFTPSPVPRAVPEQSPPVPGAPSGVPLLASRPVTDRMDPGSVSASAH